MFDERVQYVFFVFGIRGEFLVYNLFSSSYDGIKFNSIFFGWYYSFINGRLEEVNELRDQGEYLYQGYSVFGGFDIVIQVFISVYEFKGFVKCNFGDDIEGYVLDFVGEVYGQVFSLSGQVFVFDKVDEVSDVSVNGLFQIFNIFIIIFWCNFGLKDCVYVIIMY